MEPMFAEKGSKSTEQIIVKIHEILQQFYMAENYSCSVAESIIIL